MNQPINNSFLSTIDSVWWKTQGFIYNNETFTWSLNYSKTQFILYMDRLDILSIVNWDDYKLYKSKHSTKSEFYTALKLCNLHEQFNNQNEKSRNIT